MKKTAILLTKLRIRNCVPLLLLVSLTTITILGGCQSTPTASEEYSSDYAQVISCTIETVKSPNQCVITDYVKYLQAGEQVTGVVQLTGSWEVDEYDWIFTVFYRGANDDAKSIFRNWQAGYVGENKHAFGFTAEQEGEYTLRITVTSRTNKDLILEVSPGGWR